MTPDPARSRDDGPPEPEPFYARIWALAAAAQQYALAILDYRAGVEGGFPGLLGELAPPPPPPGLYRTGPLRN